MRNTLSTVLLVGMMLLTGKALAAPLNFSFAGTFDVDDDVQLFNFTSDGTSTVYLVSYAYGGGTQANGAVHAQGGMDTIVTLFDSTGAFYTSNDDGSSICFGGAEALGPGIDAGNTDTNTGAGAPLDPCYSSVLAAGDYTVAVSQFDNIANGPNLTDGFQEDGQGNFTGTLGECSNGSFCDVSGLDPFNNRTNVWAYDILNVSAADVVVPAPAAAWLFGSALLGLGVVKRKKA
jgi:hypothetical protein